MAARDKMKAALRREVIPLLEQAGFTGKYPHFRRVRPDRIELLAFQWNKWGHSFTVEVSLLFPDRQGKAANFCSDTPQVTMSEATVWDTNRRFRLKGMYDGWFYYTDVYRRRCFLQKPSYIPVGEKDAQAYRPGRGERLVQKADEAIYSTVCAEVNRQMASAEQWWERMARNERI